MNAPTRQEIRGKLTELLNGTLTRQAASDWAIRWIVGKRSVHDEVAWDALLLLGAADLISTDRPFLYTDIDFEACMSQLDQKTEP